MTASSKVRIGRLDAHPRETGSLRIYGALPTCMEAYKYRRNRLSVCFL